MIYAKFQYAETYEEMHQKIVDLLSQEFPMMQEGLQGDSWISVWKGKSKVEIDSFTSMQHEVKSDSNDLDFIKQVISVLQREFTLIV